MFRVIACLLLCGSLSSTLGAEDVNGDGWVSVLIPIAFSSGQTLEGGYGSLWTTEVWMHNGTEFAMDRLHPNDNCELSDCPEPGYPSGFFGMISVTVDEHDGGTLLYLYAKSSTGAEPEDVHFQLRLLELSRRSQPTGVEIPVIREGQFVTGEAVLIAVPVGETIRSTLRVYDPMISTGGAIVVEALNPEGEVVAETMLHPDTDGPSSGGFPRTPGFSAVYNLTDAFPQLRDLSHFHVRLRPLNEDTHFWAFVSVTDTESQHVLLITPQ